MLILTRLLRSSKLAILFLMLGLFLSFVSASYAATVELVALGEPLKPGVFPVFIYVDSEDVPTIGTDLLIKYDSSSVRFERIEFQGIYPQEHEVQHDINNHTIRFSGTNEFNSYTPVRDIIAIAYFRSLSEISSTAAFLTRDNPPIKLVWSKEATNDTNVVSAEGSDLLMLQPPKLRIDSSFGEGVVKGAFSDAQNALLAENGIIAEATQVPIKMNITTVVGVVLILGSIFIFILFFVKKRKKKEEEEDV